MNKYRPWYLTWSMSNNLPLQCPQIEFVFLEIIIAATTITQQTSSIPITISNGNCSGRGEISQREIPCNCFT